MAQASGIQNSFASGELSELMLGRSDLDVYKKGLFICLNGVPLVQGPWTRRPGFAFLHQVKDNSVSTTRLLPFQYSTTQTYVLEFGAAYIRFFTSHGILTNTAQSITSISKANPGVLTKVAHGYSNGDHLQLSSVVGMSQVNNREVVVTNKTADTFELYDTDGAKINTTSADTFTSGNMAKILELATPYAAADLAKLRITQSADTLYLFHPLYAPRSVVRVSALSWTLNTLNFTDGPYDTINTGSTTLSPSGATGTVTITASAVTGINSDTGFKSTDVGRLIRMQEGSLWGYAQILTYSSTTSVVANVLATLTNTNAKTSWRLGVWSDTTGYPAAGTFYEDRLAVGGAATYPQRVDLSNSGAYTNFAPSALAGTVGDSNAIAFTMNSEDVNAIKWLSPNERGLLAGTTRGEWQIRASTLGVALTPTNVTGKPITRRGSADAAPVISGRATLFIQRASRKLREMAYTIDVDGFKTPDMTQLAEHITDPTITEMAYMENPQSIIWAVRSDGVLLGFTYDRDAGVVAWHRHELGGYSDAAKTLIPAVESICVVTSPDGTHDELYAIVKRYINGGVKRYIEYMTPFWQVGDTQADAFYVDAGWTQTNTIASTGMIGLHFLEGETVGLYVDGMKLADKTVTNAKITAEFAGLIMTTGYYYNSDAQMLPIEGGSQDGASVGKMKRADRLALTLVDTLGIKFGPDTSSLTEYIFREWGDTMGAATPLFTGVISDRFEGDYTKIPQPYWRCDGPFPATVCAAMPQFATADDS